MSEQGFNASGSKYLREVPCIIQGKVDVYAVLDAFAQSANRPLVVKLAVRKMPGSGSPAELMAAAGIDAAHIVAAAKKMA